MEFRRQEIVTCVNKRPTIIPERKIATQRVPVFEIFHRRGNGPANRMSQIGYSFASNRVATMRISSRTPEGSPNRCPVCGKAVRMEPSTNSANTADAPCPHCGCLMWFDAQQVRVSELVEETKLQIRQWKNRFTELSQSATDSDAYYHEMLTGVIQALAAKGGAVWTRERGRMQLQIKVGIGSETIDDRPIFRPSHLSLLTNAITAARSAVVQPSGHGPSLRGNSNPTEFLLVLAPIKRKAKAIALIEIFQRTGSSISVQRGYLRFLEQVCEIAGNSAVVDDGKTE